MSLKPYTDDEIVAMLKDGRMAATDKRLAARLACHHSLAKFETDDLSRPRGSYRKATKEAVLAQIDRFCVRVTIPRPPKRRALRREELPERFQVSIMGSNGYWYIRNNPVTRDTKITGPLWRFRESESEEWKEGYIDDPQEPLVITTEGGE